MKKLGHDILRILLSQFSILIILVGLIALGFLFREPVLITYHRFGVRSALKGMRRYARPEFRPDGFHHHEDRLKRHRKALIRLGYLEERTFHTEFLSMNSPQTESMLAEFRRRHPGCSYTIGWGSALTITDRPERMPTWESLVQEYDVPPSEPCQPDAPGDAAEARRL